MRPWRHRHVMVPSPDFRSRGTMTQALRDYIADYPGITREALWSATTEFPHAQAGIVNPRGNFHQALKRMLRDEQLREEEGRLYPTQRLRVTPRSEERVR